MKQIVKKFNNLIEKTIFKVQNKTNNNFKISNFNKYLITFISLLFFYLFYLLIPIIYDKTWVQTTIESKLLDEFKINISASSDIAYRILPTPHFLIKDSKIFLDEIKKPKSIAEIKNLKVFLHQSNFFDKKKMNIKKVIINKANFSLSRKDLKLLSKFSNNHFSNKKIKISNSNIFFKDNSYETITIIKIDKAFLFFDDQNLFNLFDLRGKVFKVPFTLTFKDKKDSIKDKTINFKAKTLKLNIFNKFKKNKDELINGKSIISFLNSTINTSYKVEDSIIFFQSDNSEIYDSKINYNGELSINPFDLNLKIDLGDYEISELLNINSIVTEFLKTELLFNESINLNTSIITNTKKRGEIFQNAKIKFNIVNGKINFDKTKLINDRIGLLELSNSDLFTKNDKLFLNTDIKINIKNFDNLFSFLQTNKKFRKEFKEILINLDYDFFTNEIEFNNVKIDNNEVNDNLLTIIDSFKDNNINNLNKSRRLLNELFKAYEG